MRIVKVHGGLGNQMFQYAYGRNLELSGQKIIFDTSFFAGNKSTKDIAREFKLDKFNIQTRAEFSKKKHLILDLWIKIKRQMGLPKDIYFQNEKYFAGIAGLIRKEFSLKEKISTNAQEVLQKIEGCNAVSLHVRRGDYVNDKKTSSYHGVCGLNYYNDAINFIKRKVLEAKFFVFSDDIKWAKENFIGEDFIFVSSFEIKDIEELILMSNCKHHIIANSSFSWWGAWLNTNLDKIVIAPKKWFNNEKANKNNIVPSGWIKI